MDVISDLGGVFQLFLTVIGGLFFNKVSKFRTMYRIIKSLYYIKMKDKKFLTPKVEKDGEKLKGIRKYISNSIRPSIQDQELANKYHGTH